MQLRTRSGFSYEPPFFWQMNDRRRELGVPGIDESGRAITLEGRSPRGLEKEEVRPKCSALSPSYTSTLPSVRNSHVSRCFVGANLHHSVTKVNLRNRAGFLQINHERRSADQLCLEVETDRSESLFRCETASYPRQSSSILSARRF